MGMDWPDPVPRLYTVDKKTVTSISWHDLITGIRSEDSEIFIHCMPSLGG